MSAEEVGVKEKRRKKKEKEKRKEKKKERKIVFFEETFLYCKIKRGFSFFSFSYSIFDYFDINLFNHRFGINSLVRIFKSKI